MIKKRDDMKSEEVISFSKSIIDRIIEMPQFIQSEFIMAYVNFGNEVITIDLINQCFAMGKKVYVPSIIKTYGNKKEIVASKISDLSNLVKGEYGIYGPSLQSLKAIDPKDLDFIVVPGVVFDIYKNRIGFGKGYYDRFLVQTSLKCYKIGLAFESQICESIPTDKHDYPLNAIATEKRII